MENTSIGNHAFIEKTKKQAKRLLKLAQSKESNLEIKNLAGAQEILAQINGYPHWHALESTITKTVSAITKSVDMFEKSEKQNIDNIINGVNCLVQENKLVSVFEVVRMPYKNISSFVNYVEDLKAKCSLQFNMGFHEIRLTISNRNQESSSNSYDFYSLSNSLGIEQSLAKKLFTLNVSIQKEEKYLLSALLFIKTNEEMASEHTSFCENFKGSSTENIFSLRTYLTSEEMSVLNHDEKKRKQVISIEGNQNLSLKNIINGKEQRKTFDNEILHKAWIHSIGLLNKKFFEWDIEVDLNNNSFVFYQLTENKNNETYLAGLYKSINKNNDIVQAKMFDFESQKESSLPWTRGIPFVNHTDNEVSFYDPGSSLQTSHQTLIYAKPGSGKSLLMNVMNLFSLGHKVSDLPYLGIVDIGPSSKPLINFLKEILPSSQKHLANYYRIKMTQDYCVNVFDTSLGCRFQSSEQKSFLHNFVLLLLTNENNKEDLQGMLSLVTSVIDDMYYQASEKGNPKEYSKGVDRIVDECLSKTEMQIDEKTFWWEIVDNLFENGFTHEAMLAQRQAVPLLVDAVSSAQSNKIRDIYSNVKVSTGETLIQYFNRSIIDLLDQYKILCLPTVFDTQESKIISIDLDEVCKPGGSNKKETEIMYMIAYYLVNKNYKENSYDMSYIPYLSHLEVPDKIPAKRYQEYHKNRIESLLSFRKIVCLDEFHRVSNNNLIQDIITAHMRDGRKWGVETIIATQSLSSITKDMGNYFTSLFIMDSGKEKELQEICNFNSDEERKILSSGKIHGPRKNRAGTMFAKIMTNGASFSKLLSFQPTPHLIAMLSSVSEDYKLREKLLTRFSIEKTLDILVNDYTDGLKSAIEIEFGYQSKEDYITILFERLVKKYS